MKALPILLIILSSWTSLRAQPKPVYGLKLAYPREIPVLQQDDSLLQRNEDEYFQCQLRLDKKGALAGLILHDVLSDERLRGYTSFFRKCRFRPGSFNGKSVPQVLPVTMYFFRDRRQPIVTLPVTADGWIGNVKLYREALELNGVTLPHLRTFPSYHSTLQGADSSIQLRYVLTSLDLDTQGSPTRIDLVRTNYPGFAGQILNAANWATYSPAKADTQAVTSSCFLLVTFFPSMQYPSRPLTLDSADTSFSQEKLAVRLLPDTLGDLSDPIPRFATDWTYPLSAIRGSWARQGIFRYRIDMYGNADLVSGGNGSAAAQQFGSELATVLRFYPAIDKRGNPTSFEGVVKVSPRDKSNVRVEFLWFQ